MPEINWFLINHIELSIVHIANNKMQPSKLQTAVKDRLSLVEQTPDDGGSPPSMMDSAEKNARIQSKAPELSYTNPKNIMRSENQPFLKPLPPLAPLLDFTQIGEQKIDSVSDELRTSIYETKEQILKQIQLFIASKRDEFETYLQLQEQEYNTTRQEESQLLQSATPTDIAEAFADDPVIEEPVAQVYGTSHLPPPVPVYKQGRTHSGKHTYFYTSPLHVKPENQASDPQLKDDADIGFEDLIGPTIGTEGTEDKANPNEQRQTSSASLTSHFTYDEYDDKEEKPVVLALNGLKIQERGRSSHVNSKGQDMSYLSSSKPMDIRPNPSLLEGDGGRPARTEAERQLEDNTPLSFSQIQNLKQTDPSNMSFSQRMEWEQLGKVGGLSQSVYD